MIAYVLKTKDNKDVHVIEVPHCFYEGMQICLSTKNKTELGKLQYLAGQFREFMLAQSESRIITDPRIMKN